MSEPIPRRPDGRPLWYGRRQGHKLRPSRRALIDELLPKLRLDAGAAGRVDPAAAFAEPMASYRLEIGFGGGEHLAGQAARHPDVGFIGCEPFVNGVAALLAEIEAEKLCNIRVFDDDVRLILGRFCEAAFDRVYILFADPWPKTRHQRRRILQTGTLDQLAGIVRPGGSLIFATDHLEYATFALERLCRHPAWRWTAEGAGDWRHPPQDWIETRYEAKAKQRGLKPVYLTFERRT